MYCPVCKAEYRQGIYRCSDCNVLLVESLPDAPEAKRAAALKHDSLLLLWEGQDPVLFTAVLNALGEEEIPFHEAPAFDRSAGGLAVFPTSYDATPTLKIRVFGADFERARRVLAALLEQRRVAGPQEMPEGPAEALPEETFSSPQEWKPKEATSQVWSGDDGAMAAFLVDTFRENRLPARLLHDPDGACRILVHPADQQRAQSILRQVREGEPPA